MKFRSTKIFAPFLIKFMFKDIEQKERITIVISETNNGNAKYINVSYNMKNEQASLPCDTEADVINAIKFCEQ